MGSSPDNCMSQSLTLVLSGKVVWRMVVGTDGGLNVSFKLCSGRVVAVARRPGLAICLVAWG